MRSQHKRKCRKLGSWGFHSASMPRTATSSIRGYDSIYQPFGRLEKTAVCPVLCILCTEVHSKRVLAANKGALILGNMVRGIGGSVTCNSLPATNHQHALLDPGRAPLLRLVARAPAKNANSSQQQCPAIPKIGIHERTRPHSAHSTFFSPIHLLHSPTREHPPPTTAPLSTRKNKNNYGNPAREKREQKPKTSPSQLPTMI
jgi:hypothetical protein